MLNDIGSETAIISKSGNLFFKSERYDLSDVGRVKLNSKLKYNLFLIKMKKESPGKGK